MHSLRLTLVHFRVRHQEPADNRRRLVAHFTAAARRGAAIAVGPELAVSGYGFQSPAAVEPYAETAAGPTLSALADVARSYGLYVCIGIAEKDPETGILYNSAFVLGPQGTILCRYRKVNAESRWACPGDPRQANIFDTPWGRVGVLICSDSYYGLMPRITALRGADLVLVPSNWPPTGLDPRELWRARALENGFHLAACNRTGVDPAMDCRPAASMVCDPHGQVLLDGGSEGTRLFGVEVPLAATGRLDSTVRRRILADRRPRHYRNCYLNRERIENISRYLALPEAGVLDLYCIVPAPDQNPAAAVEKCLDGPAAGAHRLCLLPRVCGSEAVLDRILQVARSRGAGLVFGLRADSGQDWIVFQDGGTRQRWPGSLEAKLAVFEFGPARMVGFPPAALTHPEPAVAAAKGGCDLALVSAADLTPDRRLLAGARTIDNLAVAVCARNGAGLWMTPQGHQRWGEVAAGPGQVLHYALDTGSMRTKIFQDRVDFEVLMRKTPGAVQ
jgi:predicted amidohydrolase